MTDANESKLLPTQLVDADEKFDALEYNAYRELKTYPQSLKESLQENYGDEWQLSIDDKRRDLFLRADKFVESFSFDDVPEMKNIPLTEEEVNYLNDFQVDCRWMFCRDGDFAVDEKTGKRVFGAKDDFELEELGYPKGFINMIKKWTMLSKGNRHILDQPESQIERDTRGLQNYDRYVLWVVEQMIARGRFQGNFDTYEYMVVYAVRHGTIKLALALFFAIYHCGKEEVAELINDNMDTILMFALHAQNTVIFHLIEKKYSRTLPGGKIDYDHALMLYCMNKADIDYGLTEHLVSRMKNPCYPVNPIELIYGEQWYRLQVLRNMLIKYGKWNITNNVINNVMYNIKEETDTEFRQRMANIFGHTLVNNKPPADDVVNMTLTHTVPAPELTLDQEFIRIQSAKNGGYF